MKAAAFALGAVPPFMPALWLLVQAPRQVWFNLVEYHLFYRRVGWPGATGNDIDVLSSWLQDTQWFVLIALAVAGWRYARKSHWDAGRRAEFRLCLWLALAMGAQSATAHPTFEQYFVLLVPFLALLGCAGLYALTTRLDFSVRPRRVALILGVFLAVTLARAVYAERDDASWRGLAAAAQKLDAVAPHGAAVLAPEQIYLLTRREPPAGLESAFANKVDLGERRNALLHILPKAEEDRQIKAGRFAAAVVCDDDARADAIDSMDVYQEQAKLGECTVFWKPAAAQ